MSGHQNITESRETHCGQHGKDHPPARRFIALRGERALLYSQKDSHKQLHARI